MDMTLMFWLICRPLVALIFNGLNERSEKIMDTLGRVEPSCVTLHFADDTMNNRRNPSLARCLHPNKNIAQG